MASTSKFTANVLAVIQPALEGIILDQLSECLAHIAKETGGDLDKMKTALESFNGVVSVSKKRGPATVPLGDGKLVIVLNYGPNSHGVFGDTIRFKDTVFAAINEKYRNEGKKKNLLSYQRNLCYGPGYTVTEKGRLGEIEEAFKKASIEFTTVDNAEYSKTYKAAHPNAVASVAPPAGIVAPPATKVVEETKAKEAPPEKTEPLTEKTEPAVPDPVVPKAKAKAKAKAAPKPAADAKVEDKIEKPAPPSSPKSKPAPKAKASKKKAPAKAPAETVAPAPDAPKPSAPKKAAAKPKAKADAKPKAEEKTGFEKLGIISAFMNAYDNFEDKNSGVVFLPVPIGPNGEKICLAYGTQEPTLPTSVKGIKSVVPLTDTDITICDENKWEYLKAEHMPIIKKYDPVLHTAIEEMIASAAAAEADAEGDDGEGGDADDE